MSKVDKHPHGAMLARWLDASGVTRGELTARLGVAQQAVGFWVRGDRGIPVARLHQIRQILPIGDVEFAQAVALRVPAVNGDAVKR